jgi:hypothetical protein
MYQQKCAASSENFIVYFFAVEAAPRPALAWRGKLAPRSSNFKQYMRKNNSYSAERIKMMRTKEDVAILCVLDD